MPGLILGSTSEYRKALLERLRVPFVCEAPGVDEGAAALRDKDPLSVAQELARSKARAVFERHPQSVVIGCDQVVTMGGERLGKPGSAAAAIAQLQRLRGREHRLLTAVAIVHPGGLAEFVDVTRLSMRALSDAEVERYVKAEQPVDCAGSYKVEALGITLFDRIDSRDHTAITGLPLLQLSAELRRLGFAMP